MVVEQEDFNMTLNEFDKKAIIRNRIQDLDDMLDTFNDLNRTNTDTYIGVGSFSDYLQRILYTSTQDDVLLKRFYKLLEERREELMDEFNK